MQRFKNILCVLKANDDAKAILTRAVALAENNQANLTVIDVLPHVTIGIGMHKEGPTLADLQLAMINGRTAELKALVAPYRKQLKIECKVLLGTPFLSIIREVLYNKRDLLIKLPEHQEWLDRFLGSDDMHLLRKCPCPVWIIKATTAKSYRRILVAVDVDKNYPPTELQTRQAMNLQILQMASSLALSEFAELHIVHAWNATGENAMRHGLFTKTPEKEVNAYVEQNSREHADTLHALLHELASAQRDDLLDYLKPQIHLVKGSPRKEIPALAKQLTADLLVIGTVARIGIPGFIMGNTAETILNQIDCSVLAIKPLGFITPVSLVD